MSDAVINSLAVAGGGIIAQLITYPLRTVNTRQQTERDLKIEKRLFGTTVAKKTNNGVTAVEVFLFDALAKLDQVKPQQHIDDNIATTSRVHWFTPSPTIDQSRSHQTSLHLPLLPPCLVEIRPMRDRLGPT
ncbi:hypothetical protein ACLB2K_069272 [Fragaria x ananassa]